MTNDAKLRARIAVELAKAGVEGARRMAKDWREKGGADDPSEYFAGLYTDLVLTHRAEAVKENSVHMATWLRSIPARVLDDWGLNAVGNIVEYIEGDESLPDFEKEDER